MEQTVYPSPAPAPKKPGWKTAFLVVVPILILCLLLVGGLSIYFGLTTRSQATEIADAAYTIDTQATAAAKAEATMQSLQTKMAAIPPGFEMTLLKGPLDGALIHNEADTKINIECASVDVDNFVVSAQFTNPYSSTEHAFDHGFRFKSFYRVIISSSGTLHFRNVGTTTTSIYSASINSIRLGAGQTNDLMVVVKGDVVFLYLNGEFAATSYAEGLSTTTGDVCVGSGFFSEHEVTGKSTGYDNFTIWTLP